MAGSGGRLARLPFFYGWVVIAVAFVTMGIGVSARTTFSLLYPPILAEFGWDRATTAAAFSVGFVASTVLAPLIGVLMDRFGPRLVMPIGGVLVAGGFMLATISYTPLHFYVSLGLLVVGGSIFMSYIGHSMFLPNWFERKRGLAVGLAFAGVGVGSIILFPLVQIYIETAGWRDACIALAVLCLVVIVPLNAIFQRTRPQEMGLEPDGDPRSADGAAKVPINIVDKEWAATEWTLARALRTGRFWWLMLGNFCALYVWYAVQVHQTKYIIDVGFSAKEAAFVLGLVGLFGIGGQIGVGWLSDRIGREMAFSVGIFGFVICYGALLGMQEAPSSTLMYLMAISQGLLGYGIASLYGAIPAELFQGKQFATIFGVMNVGAGLGAAVGPWLTGYIYDVSGTYTPAFWLAIVLCVVSSACVWLAAPRKVRLVGAQALKRQRMADAAEAARFR